MIIVPVASLDRDTLRSLAEAYITREGTDYGDIEQSLAEKVSQLLSRIDCGEVLITFDEASESVNLVRRDDPLLGREYL